MTDGETQLAPFAGVDAPNTTPVPDVYFDVLFPHLGKAALKVLLYLTRRIFGFKREADTVSLSRSVLGFAGVTVRYWIEGRGSHGMPQPVQFATWNRSASSSQHAVCPLKATRPRRPTGCDFARVCR